VEHDQRQESMIDIAPFRVAILLQPNKERRPCPKRLTFQGGEVRARSRRLSTMVEPTHMAPQRTRTRPAAVAVSPQVLLTPFTEVRLTSQVAAEDQQVVEVHLIIAQQYVKRTMTVRKMA